MNYWLVKQEPEDYPWEQFLAEGSTSWTGVRNFQARNFLKAMVKGDRVLFYHSGKEKSVVGTAVVSTMPYADPTAKEGGWWCVDLKPLKSVSKPVALGIIKREKELRGIGLVRQSRLSVMPLTGKEFEKILELGNTRL